MKIVNRIFSYSGISILSSLIPFFSLPFITNVLGSEQFGLYSLWFSIATVTASSLLFGTPASFATYYKRNDKKAKKIVYSYFYILLYCAFPVLIMLSMLLAGIKYGITFLGFGFFVILRSFFLFYSNYVRVTERIYRYFAVMIICQLCMFAFPVLTSVVVDVRFTAFELITLMAFIITIPLLLFFVSDFSFLTENVSRRFIIFELKTFGAYASLHVIFSSFITLSDRFVLSVYLAREEFSIYALAAMLVSALSLVFNKFSQALSVELYKALDDSTDKLKIIFKWLKAYLAILLLGWGVFLLFVELLVDLFFDATYITSVSYARFLSLGILFQGLYFYFSQLLMYFRASKGLLKLSFFLGVLGLSLTIVLSWHFNIYGAIFSFVFVWFLYFLVTFYLVYRTAINRV